MANICVSLFLLLLLSPAFCSPLRHDEESHASPLGAVSDLTSHVGGGVGRHARDEARLPLPLPGAQEIEAIKKVAQILVMLGEQVIPAIIGDPGGAVGVGGAGAGEVSADEVDD